MSLGLVPVEEGNWQKVRRNFQRLNSILLGTTSTPTFSSLTLTGLTANSLVYTPASKVLTSLGAAINGQLVIGSTGAAPVLATLTQGTGITVTNAAGSITIATTVTQYADELAQDAVGGMVANTATINLTYTDLTPSLTADLNATLKSNYDIAYTHVSSTGDDHTWLNQDITTTASPTLAGLTVTGNSILGLNSAVFQPAADSTTFFQILDADGGTPIFNVDSTNERVGIGTTTPETKLEVTGDLAFTNDQTERFIRSSVNGGAIRLRGNSVANTDRNIQFGNVDNNTVWISFMTVAESGNVGIGTTVPAAKFSIGTIGTLAIPTYSTIDQIQMQMYDVIADNSRRYLDIASIGAQNGTAGGGIIRFITNPIDSNNGVERMRIERDGNVSIGANFFYDNVNNKLTLTGTIDASAGKLLAEDNDTSAPDVESDGYIGVAIIGGVSRVYFAVSGGMYYINGIAVSTPVAGNPIGLLLTLTYAA
mgnify:FL=1